MDWWTNVLKNKRVPISKALDAQWCLSLQWSHIGYYILRSHVLAQIIGLERYANVG